MADVLLSARDIAARRSQALECHGLERERYLLVTAHRPGNVDAPDRLALLVELLVALPAEAIFPVHPRTRARLESAGLIAELDRASQIKLIPPLGYLDFLTLARNARAILTDSGGLQKEALLLGVPCLTLRDTTEWVETVDSGWNVLVDLDREAALAALERGRPASEPPDLYGGGRAGERIRDVVSSYA